MQVHSILIAPRVHSILVASRVHSTFMASRVNPASSILGLCKPPSFIPNKPRTPQSNAGSGSMIGIANYPFSSSRSSFRLSSKGFDPTYELFARRMFSVNAKINAKTMPEEVDLSHPPAAPPKKKATTSSTS